MEGLLRASNKQPHLAANPLDPACTTTSSKQQQQQQQHQRNNPSACLSCRVSQSQLDAQTHSRLGCPMSTQLSNHETSNFPSTANALDNGIGTMAYTSMAFTAAAEAILRCLRECDAGTPVGRAAR